MMSDDQKKKKKAYRNKHIPNEQLLHQCPMSCNLSIHYTINTLTV